MLLYTWNQRLDTDTVQHLQRTFCKISNKKVYTHAIVREQMLVTLTVLPESILYHIRISGRKTCLRCAPTMAIIKVEREWVSATHNRKRITWQCMQLHGTHYIECFLVTFKGSLSAALLTGNKGKVLNQVVRKNYLIPLDIPVPAYLAYSKDLQEFT